MSRIASPGGGRQREPRVKDKAYLGWIAQLPCLACLCRGRRTWPVEVAHIKASFPLAGWRAFGHAEKSHDARTISLCAADHRTGPIAQHANLGGDEREYWRKLSVYPPDLCRALYEAYEAGESGLHILQKASMGGFPFPADA